MAKRIIAYFNFRKVEYSKKLFIEIIEAIMLNINEHIIEMINKQRAFIEYLKDANFISDEDIENLPRFNT